MSTKLLTAVIPFTLATALAFSATSLAADSALHDDSHGDTPLELQLNNGEKWAIDAPLGKAMGDISTAMRQSIETIDEKPLSAVDFAPLASQLNDSITYMVTNCDLSPDADAQLHKIIAQLMAGSDKMVGKNTEATPHDGVMQVLGALEAYDQYFDDPDFVPITQ